MTEQQPSRSVPSFILAAAVGVILGILLVDLALAAWLMALTIKAAS